MMTIRHQAEKSKRLLELHHGPHILILANAWDAASARIFEKAGFPAIATTSAGIANALGYPDGERISREEMLEMVERIARAVAVPVTADLEAGYGHTPAELAETARAAIAAGAVGLNLEDSTGNGQDSLVGIPLQKEKIRAMLDAAAAEGVPLVINARTDVFLAEGSDPATRITRAAERLNAYWETGAQCLFAPGARDRETIAKLVKEVHGPLNILASEGTPPIPELESLGVARVSVGSGPMRATLGLVKRIAQELVERGTYSIMTQGSFSYAEANRLFRGG